MRGGENHRFEIIPTISGFTKTKFTIFTEARKTLNWKIEAFAKKA
jgi:hypothetical protein